MAWILENHDYSLDSAADNGNRFLLGNGYMGLRGVLEEQGREALAALNLAGIYDKVGSGWREPLNAPYPLTTVLSVGGQKLTLPERAPKEHTLRLDFYHGILERRTVWDVDGVDITLESRRLVCRNRFHLLAQSYTVTASAPVEAELLAEISREIWEIHGPHYEALDFSAKEDTLLCRASVQNSDKAVAVARRCRLGSQKEEMEGAFRYRLRLEAGVPLVLESLSAVYTTEDCPDPAASALAELAAAPDFAALEAEHKAAWEKVWAVGKVEIQGDLQAEEALNYALYHLNSISPRHGEALSIPARGLSGQTYKGAVFWDSEMFILDYFLFTQPEVARSMVQYRIDTLPGALEKAKSYGFQGAFYAWESQEGGFDGCSDYNVTDVFTGRPMRTYFRDKQVHISAAVARAIMLYTKVTGDRSLLAVGGARTVLECARFYESLLLGRVTGNAWEIHDVIGPDEYHERVNNNAYTNRVAKATLLWAVEAAALLKAESPLAYADFCRETAAEALLPRFQAEAEGLYVPEPGETGVIPQFDGYFDLEDASLEEVRSRLLNPKEYWGGAYGVASHTQVIKQADVVTMLELFHGDYDREILEKNWAYYEPRTEHGSSLSACMYGLLACRFGQPDKAYPFFLKSALADWKGGGKQWAGLVYIGGTHPAAEGGAWKVLTQGFCGLDWDENGPRLTPCLPSHWEKAAFSFRFGGKWYRAEVTQKEAKCLPLKI